MELPSHVDKVETKYTQLLDLEPKLLSAMVPANGPEQKQQFLSGATVNPEHVYPKLEIADEKIAAIEDLGRSILDTLGPDSSHNSVYEEFVEGYVKKTRLMQAMHAFNTAVNHEEQQAARREFMQLNIELYGAPERTTYRSLLQEKLAGISAKQLSDTGMAVYHELVALIPGQYLEKDATVERFKPSNETVGWMHDAVISLYSGMLDHVPEQETFTVHEVRDIFDEVLQVEFGESAEGWRVDIEPAKSINVKSPEKRIVIPEDRGELSRGKVRELIVHEIGVHTLRSITGAMSDVGPLRTGLSEYYESEEGLGKVMEQALNNTYVEAGVEYYITAGMAYIDGKDFRETFELKWRLGALTKLRDGEELSQAAVESAKDGAYKDLMRIFRGTDELPWFKDLAYYNGSVETWKFLEDIRGDDLRLTLLMMGKVNSSDEHLRTILESKTP